MKRRAGYKFLHVFRWRHTKDRKFLAQSGPDILAHYLECGRQSPFLGALRGCKRSGQNFGASVVTNRKKTDQTGKYTTMATITSDYANHAHAAGTNKAERVATILRWTYGLVPIVAGADKFMHLLTDWDKYLAPIVTDIIPLSPATFMSIVGVIEIIAGILVLVKPKLGSFIVGCWLVAIAINLLFTGQYFDVAVRDIVMGIGAFSLFLLSANDKHPG